MKKRAAQIDIAKILLGEIKWDLKKSSIQEKVKGDVALRHSV
jgi:hypothetical protein